MAGDSWETAINVHEMLQKRCKIPWNGSEIVIMKQPTVNWNVKDKYEEL